MPKRKAATTEQAHIPNENRRVTRLGRLGPRTSPNRFFPVELLEEVFSINVHSGVEDRDDWMVPLSLSHVCRHWRGVVRNTPRLWTFILLKASYSSPKRITYWLERSGGCLLNVGVHDKFLRLKAGRVKLQALWRLVLDHSARWQSLTLMLGPQALRDGVYKDLVGSFSGVLPSLESFEFRAPPNNGKARERYGAEDIRMECSFFLQRAPKIRKLSASFCHPTLASQDNIGYKWSGQITHLELNEAYLSWTSLHKMLCHVPMLENLVLDVSIGGWSRVDVRDLPAITLSRVHDLTISYPKTRLAKRGSCIAIFHFLKVPALSSLSLRGLKAHHCRLGNNRPGEYVGKWLHKIMSNLESPLRSLTLDDVIIEDSRFYQSLELASALETLDITDSPVTLSFFSGSIKSTSPPPLPSLQTLKLNGCDNISNDTLKDLIANSCGKSLSYVKVMDCALINVVYGCELQKVGEGSVIVEIQDGG